MTRLRRPMLEFCQGKLARFKQPQVVEFVDEIPRNPSGKILKRVSASRLTGRRASIVARTPGAVR